MNNELISPITFETYEEPQLIRASNRGCNHPRIGETIQNKYGTTMTIIEYYAHGNITVQFISFLSTGEQMIYIKYNQSYANFIKGELKSPYDCTKYGIGYIGVGPYGSKTHKKYYSAWSNMFTRCYNPKSLEVRPGYIGCYVDPFFHNFQNFCYWCDFNYYEVGNETMCLDKDILYDHNKVYGPHTCVFVPQTINKLFTYSKTTRQIGNPIGITYRVDRNLYEAYCSINGKNTSLGYFKDKWEAFDVYKEAKEKDIKRVTNAYKQFIPPILYDRMMNYIVYPER